VTYSVFVSHCMAREDSPIIEDFVGRLRGRGMAPYLAERDPQPGRHLSSKILERIRQSDLVTVFWTRSGSASEWVNQEIGAARAEGKPVVPLVEKGVRIGGLLEGIERVEFDRDDPDSALSSLERFLAGRRDAKEARERETEFWQDVGTAAAIVTVVVAVLVIVLLAARK